MENNNLAQWTYGKELQNIVQDQNAYPKVRPDEFDPLPKTNTLDLILNAKDKFDKKQTQKKSSILQQTQEKSPHKVIDFFKNNPKQDESYKKYNLINPLTQLQLLNQQLEQLNHVQDLKEIKLEMNKQKWKGNNYIEKITRGNSPEKLHLLKKYREKLEHEAMLERELALFRNEVEFKFRQSITNRIYTFPRCTELQESSEDEDDSIYENLDPYYKTFAVHPTYTYTLPDISHIQSFYTRSTGSIPKHQKVTSTMTKPRNTQAQISKTNSTNKISKYYTISNQGTDEVKTFRDFKNGDFDYKDEIATERKNYNLNRPMNPTHGKKEDFFFQIKRMVMNSSKKKRLEETIKEQRREHQKNKDFTEDQLDFYKREKSKNYNQQSMEHLRSNPKKVGLKKNGAKTSRTMDNISLSPSYTVPSLNTVKPTQNSNKKNKTPIKYAAKIAEISLAQNSQKLLFTPKVTKQQATARQIGMPNIGPTPNISMKMAPGGKNISHIRNKTFQGPNLNFTQIKSIPQFHINSNSNYPKPQPLNQNKSNPSVAKKIEEHGKIFIPNFINSNHNYNYNISISNNINIHPGPQQNNFKVLVQDEANSPSKKIHSPSSKGSGYHNIPNSSSTAHPSKAYSQKSSGFQERNFNNKITHYPQLKEEDEIEKRSASKHSKNESSYTHVQDSPIIVYKAEFEVKKPKVLETEPDYISKEQLNKMKKTKSQGSTIRISEISKKSGEMIDYLGAKEIHLMNNPNNSKEQFSFPSSQIAQIQAIRNKQSERVRAMSNQKLIDVQLLKTIQKNSKINSALNTERILESNPRIHHSKAKSHNYSKGYSGVANEGESYIKQYTLLNSGELSSNIQNIKGSLTKRNPISLRYDQENGKTQPKKVRLAWPNPLSATRNKKK